MYSSGLFFHFALPLLLIINSCNGQTAQNKQIDNLTKIQAGPRVGGPCETCELIYVGMPENINSTDTSAGWHSKGQKLIITGTVYKPDRKTPAPNIILYYWQTNEKGEYADKQGLDSRAMRHGHIRGWVKTDKQGQYQIYTVRPAPYPSRSEPAHVHMLVKEPDINNEYYIDNILFEDDPLLSEKKKARLEKKVGNGMVRPVLKNGIQRVNRNIILGLNITDYPSTR